METLISPPRTMMELYDMLPEGTLAELIDNQIYMSPAPLFKHHKITKAISKQLDKIIEDTGKGIVIYAPFDVKLDKTRNAVQPDIFIILKTNPNQIEDDRYTGVPDLIVEILSKGNKDHDLITKKELYEKFGVQEYWVVDPETKLAIGFSLKEKQTNSYQYQKINEAIGKIQSPFLQTDFEF